MSTTELVVIIAISVVAALVKSVVGMGYPMLLVPALALFLDIADAIVIVAPSNLALNLLMTWSNRAQRAVVRTLKPFILVGAVGTVVGTLLLPVLPDRFLRVVLFGIIVAFLVDRQRSRRGGDSTARDPRETDRYAGAVGFVAGIFQGAAGVSGPIVSAWFLTRQMAVDAFVFALTANFAIHGMVQLGVLAAQPQFSEQLVVGLVLAPCALAMVPVGKFLRQRLDTSRFEQLVIAVLIAAAISLLVRVL